MNNPRIYFCLEACFLFSLSSSLRVPFNNSKCPTRLETSFSVAWAIEYVLFNFFMCCRDCFRDLICRGAAFFRFFCFLVILRGSLAFLVTLRAFCGIFSLSSRCPNCVSTPHVDALDDLLQYSNIQFEMR